MKYNEIVKRRVLKAIKQATETYPVSSATLARKSNPYSGDAYAPTHPGTRKIIRELVKEGNPIASNGKGYFYIRSGKQLQRYLNSLLQRQTALADRISDTYYGYFNSKKGN
jgi:hypothetical protein